MPAPHLRLLLLLALFTPAASAVAAPQVVVTIKPLHALVAGVMAGVGTPTLLIPGAGSPHSYSLRPSDARELSRADLVVRISEDFETFLNRPLATLAAKARVLSVATLPGLKLLPAREGGVWESAAHHGEGTGADRHGHGELNLHLWLDPTNAEMIVAGVSALLAEIDPGNAESYRANAGHLRQRLTALDQELRKQLQAVAGLPYIVFHDAFPYFEARYGLSPAGAISVSPERTPGARRLSEIRNRIKQVGARCVFSEPQFEPRLATLLTAGTGARTGILDPLGADLAAGPEAYFTLLRTLAANLVTGLSPPGTGPGK
ncbi:zinc ABC transporter substrate-binding protein ZnuA [Desulfuromonas carbonis]|uniref:zinc ABC transporter substrate-binding protein n=1 Tax=Desulfuromonas sp. DDH964 TaxID=1823759 RepID=UPI00078B7541|nr:zinc ABC transporter substrate-binding protein [Desulfuromonas sp. DDH964]AMV70949.1 periplasmic divalent manganese/zinc-binding lipoprotein [Desulfuromonas sp. DDH964]